MHTAIHRHGPTTLAALLVMMNNNRHLLVTCCKQLPANHKEQQPQKLRDHLHRNWKIALSQC